VKRGTVVIVILLMLGSLLFAQDSYIGGSVGLEYEKSSTGLEFLGGSSDDVIEITGTALNFSVTGANYFGNSSLWGVGYTLGLTKALLAKSGGSSIDVKDLPIATTVSLKGQRKFAVNNNFNFHLGVGASLGFQSEKESGLTASTSIYHIIVDALATYKIGQSISIGLGLSAGTPVYSKVTLKGDGASFDFDVDVKGFYAMPYIGVLYNY